MSCVSCNAADPKHFLCHEWFNGTDDKKPQLWLFQSQAAGSNGVVNVKRAWDPATENTTDFPPNGGGDCKGNGTPDFREIWVGEILWFDQIHVYSS